MRKEKTLRELNLEDDFMFAKVMMDEEICKSVLERILGFPIQKIRLLENQKTIENVVESKGVRLDVYVTDENNNVFNVEMQRTNKEHLPRRSRYYQANMDLDLILKGERYEKLPPTYIIFICTFDLYNQGRHVYSFANYCEQDKLIPMGDATKKIFVNTRGTLDDIDVEMKQFLKYVEHSNEEVANGIKSEFLNKIHQKVESVRISKEAELEYMTLLMREQEKFEEGRQEGRQEGIQEGRQEGREEERIKIAKKMLQKGNDVETIIEMTELSREKVESLLKEIN